MELKDYSECGPGRRGPRRAGEDESALASLRSASASCRSPVSSQPRFAGLLTRAPVGLCVLARLSAAMGDAAARCARLKAIELSHPEQDDDSGARTRGRLLRARASVGNERQSGLRRTSQRAEPANGKRSKFCTQAFVQPVVQHPAHGRHGGAADLFPSSAQDRCRASGGRRRSMRILRRRKRCCGTAVQRSALLLAQDISGAMLRSSSTHFTACRGGPRNGPARVERHSSCTTVLPYSSVPANTSRAWRSMPRSTRWWWCAYSSTRSAIARCGRIRLARPTTYRGRWRGDSEQRHARRSMAKSAGNRRSAWSMPWPSALMPARCASPYSPAPRPSPPSARRRGAASRSTGARKQAVNSRIAGPARTPAAAAVRRALLRTG